MTDRPWLPRWLLPAVVAAVVAPIAAAVVAQRNADWHPVFDLAMTELRVRDVGGPHTPLIGLQGRIGPSGSHPGPISFYLLAPIYRLLGSSSFALQAATGVLNAAAAVTALLVVRRRRDARAVVAVGLVLLLLVQGYGLGTLTEPWNPHLPVLWFVVFLVSAWAVVDGDLPMLVPAVAAASICAQTHVPYLAVTLGLGALVTAAAGLHAWRRRGGPSARDWRWLPVAAATGLLLWVPPLVDEVVHEPGNLSQIVDALGSPEEDPVGMEAAGRAVRERLDAWQLLVVETAHPGTYVRTLSGPGGTQTRGTITLTVWAASVAGAAWMRHRRLLALHAVVAAGQVVAVLAISRIYGVLWPYLMLWTYGITALMVLSIAATGAALVLRRWGPHDRAQVHRATAFAGLVVVAALSVRLLAIAPDTTTETPDQTGRLARLVPPTLDALEAHVGVATGDGGRYFVEWSDATHGGSEGIGLVNELVRHGYDVGVDAREGVKIGAGRVWQPGEATARIVYATGGWIDQWAAVSGAVRVAFDDPRTRSEVAEYERVRQDAIDALVASGRPDLAERLDTNLFGIALNEGVDGTVNLLLARMLDLGVPAAVFVVPVGAP